MLLSFHSSKSRRDRKHLLAQEQTPPVEADYGDSLLSDAMSRSKSSWWCAGLRSPKSAELSFLRGTCSLWWLAVSLIQSQGIACALQPGSSCSCSTVRWVWHPDTSSKRMTIYLTDERHRVDITWSVAERKLAGLVGRPPAYNFPQHLLICAVKGFVWLSKRPVLCCLSKLKGLPQKVHHHWC